MPACSRQESLTAGMDSWTLFCYASVFEKTFRQTAPAEVSMLLPGLIAAAWHEQSAQNEGSAWVSGSPY
eukprot:1153279-Pelagomonas_calceolata.AAC.2